MVLRNDKGQFVSCSMIPCEGSFFVLEAKAISLFQEYRGVLALTIKVLFLK